MDLIIDKIRQSTNTIFRENMETMVGFGLITDKQKELMIRILDDFKYMSKKLQYSTFDIFVRYHEELFSDELLKKLKSHSEG